jgi:hypothetical protein
MSRSPLRRARPARPAGGVLVVAGLVVALLAVLVPAWPAGARTVVSAQDQPGPTDGSGPLVAVAAPAPDVTIVNKDAGGRPMLRFDTAGNAVDAHDGSIQQFTYQGRTRYYWYGTAEDCGLGWQRTRQSGNPNPTPWCGFAAYASDDLTTWTFEGMIASGLDPAWQTTCGWLSCWRPKVVYNPLTHLYVVWANTLLGPSGYSTWTSPTPTGPWTFRGHPTVTTNAGNITPNDPRNQDESLFVDDSGAGYVVITDATNFHPVVERLTSDYLSSTGVHSVVPASPVESPTMFKHAGRYYLLVGTPNRGYASTGTAYLWADTPLGQWTWGGSLSSDSFGGQFTHVAPWRTTDGRTVVVFESDLWHHREFPVPFGYPNQGLAGLSLSPLTWAPDGITPVLPSTPQWTEKFRFVDTGAQDRLLPGSDFHSPGPGPWYYSCDVRKGLRRSFTFTAPDSGVLTSLRVNIARSEYPDDNAYLDLLAGSNGNGTPVLATGVIPASGPGWTARGYTWRPDVALTAGATYTVVLRSANAAADYSCFGFVYQAATVSGPTQGAAAMSVNGGAWRATGERVKFDLGVTATVPRGPTAVSAPVRLADTEVAAGYDTEVRVSGVDGVPAVGVIGVWVNVTVDQPAGDGQLVAYPGDGTSTIDNTFAYRRGDVRAFAALVRVGADGTIRVASSSRARVVVDLTGWVMDDAVSADPGRLSILPRAARALDTRVTGAAPGPGGTVDVVIGGVSVPAGASAVLVNLTGVAPTSDTYVAAYPAGSAWDGTSSFNLVAHEVARSNRALISLPPGGRLELLNQAGVTNLVVDVVGYVTPIGGTAGEVAPIDPVRAKELTPPPANPRTFSVAVGGLPAAVGAGPTGAAVLAVTERSAASAGFIVVYPTGQARPPTSDLNYPAGVGVSTSNLTVTSLGGATTVQAATNTNDGQVLVTVTGYVT